MKGGMMNKMIKFLERIFKPIFMPFKRKILLPLKSLKKWPIIVAKKIRTLIKSILNPKDITIKNYIKVGRYYVAKKLLVILGLVIGLLIYFLFINPPSFINKLFNHPTVLLEQTDRAMAFNGKARILNDDGDLVYEGALADGMYTGFGKLYNENNQLTYKGNFQNGLRHGFGEEYSIKDGSLLYRGNFENDQKQGTGETYHSDGYLLYKGEHKNDSMTGYGEVYNKEKELVYKGDVVSGQYFGNGILYEKEKVIYDGQFRNGKFAGNGSMFYPSGRIKYEGEFQNGQYGGSGVTYFYNGNLFYEGSFINGEYSGDGTLYYINGLVKYKGQQLLGKYHGEGVYYENDGMKVYEGNYQNGMYHGKGTHFNEHGVLYEGDFKEDRYHQLGTLFNNEGHTIYKGFFDEGAFAPWKFIGLVPSRIEEIYGEPSSLEVDGLIFENIDELAKVLSDDAEILTEDEDIESESELEEEIIPHLPATMIYEEYGLSFYIEASEDDEIPRVTEVMIKNKQLSDLILDEIKEKIEHDENHSYKKSTVQDPNYAKVIIYRKGEIVYQFNYRQENKIDSLIINGTIKDKEDEK